MEMHKYQILDDAEIGAEAEVHEVNDNIRIKILDPQGKSLPLVVKLSDTADKLFIFASKEFGLDIERVRLIFNGTVLTVNASIAGLKLFDGCVIHLFPRKIGQPLPSATLTSSSADPSLVAVVSLNPVSPNNTIQIEAANVFPAGAGNNELVFYDPEIVRNSREVRLWCWLLGFVSAIHIMSITSYFSSHKTEPIPSFEIAFNIINFILSLFGIVVTFLGLRSTRDLNLTIIKKYVWSLVTLASISVLVRVSWVVCLVVLTLTTHQDFSNVDDAATADDDSESKKDDINDETDVHVSRDSMAVFIGFQGLIIAAITAFVWGTCVFRAVRFRSAVEAYQQAVHVLPNH